MDDDLKDVWLSKTDLYVLREAVAACIGEFTLYKDASNKCYCTYKDLSDLIDRLTNRLEDKD